MIAVIEIKHCPAQRRLTAQPRVNFSSLYSTPLTFSTTSSLGFWAGMPRKNCLSSLHWLADLASRVCNACKVCSVHKMKCTGFEVVSGTELLLESAPSLLQSTTMAGQRRHALPVEFGVSDRIFDTEEELDYFVWLGFFRKNTGS